MVCWARDERLQPGWLSFDAKLVGSVGCGQPSPALYPPWGKAMMMMTSLLRLAWSIYRCIFIHRICQKTELILQLRMSALSLSKQILRSFNGRTGIRILVYKQCSVRKQSNDQNTQTASPIRGNFGYAQWPQLGNLIHSPIGHQIWGPLWQEDVSPNFALTVTKFVFSNSGNFRAKANPSKPRSGPKCQWLEPNSSADWAVGSGQWEHSIFMKLYILF